MVSAFVVLLTTGCPSHGASPSRPNVVLITMDATRADHLGCYGNDQIQTPTIDALADRSLRFDRCFAAAPITLPSHTTMLTGLYPLNHSVRDNGTFSVPEGLPTLATILGGAGWTTLGVIGAFPLTSPFGLSRDFDFWDESFERRGKVLLPLAFEQRSADRVTRTALRMVKNHDEGPFFLFVHYFDPHRPWEAPALYARRYRHSPYDAEIAFTDACIGRLLKGLEEMGHTNDTVIILAADHGEGLNDHEEETHSYLLFNGTVRVPLMLSGPGIERGVVDRPVSLADIAPTVLDILGLEAPRKMDGVSLLNPPSDDRLVYSECLAGRLQHEWNDMRAAISGDRKLILGAPSELYDIRDDLGENEDLAADEPDIAADMERRLRALITEARPVRSLEESFTAADPETRAGLEALGYVIAPEIERNWSEMGDITPEGDPRTHIGLVEVQSIGRSLINEGNIPLALEILNEALAKSPDDFELLRLVIMALAVGGDGEGAVTLVHRLEGLRTPTAQDLRLFIMAYRLNSDLEKALETVRLEKGMDDSGIPDLIEVDLLGQMGRNDEARVLLDGILDADSCNPDALQMLAVACRAEHDLQGMAGAYRRMLECDTNDPRAHYNLGNVAYENGDLEGAERAYLEAAKIDPLYQPARFGLALIALDRGESETCRTLLEAIVAAEPLNSELGHKGTQLLDILEADNG
jgi:arylsulfatase A-like enzyme/Flp pilus assembly protein TadD